MKFCSQCASPVTIRLPNGDTKERHVCNECAEIHYQNPKIVAGCIPEWEGRILLCRRAIEPRHGLWTIPAGFMENGETVEQAAMRETLEEACAHVEISGLYAVFNIPHVSLETALFFEEEIPWSEMAFPVVVQALERFFSDRPRNAFPPFVDTVTPLNR